jgi:D-xylose transport system permease protein
MTNVGTDLPTPSLEKRVGLGQSRSLREEFAAYIAGVRSGHMGSLPALVGLLILTALFSFMSPVFLSNLNYANLLQQSAPLITLSMGLVFTLLLAEIDLSAGVTSGLTSAVLVVVMATHGVPWWLAIIVSLATGVGIGLGIGLLVSKVGIPSFVVTLAAFLAFQGLQIIVIGQGGLYRVESKEILYIENGNISPSAGWVLVAVVIVLQLATGVWGRYRRAKRGHSSGSMSLFLTGTAATGLLLVVSVYVLNQQRSPNPSFPISGVPLVVPIVAGMFILGTVILKRTKFGIHVYAVGGNSEAARRAGIPVGSLRIVVFMICSGLAAVSGLLTASRIGSVDAAAGRTIVLNGVAAAVVGGVSLFGGRGRLKDAIIGGLVIAVIENGLGLLGLPSGLNLAVTGAVLLIAATADALSRKRA